MRSSSISNAIFKILEAHDDHLTAKEIYKEVKKTQTAVDTSTVYRTLERLVHNGKVSVSDMGGPAVVYELVSKNPHHHLVCEQCGKMLTFKNDEVAGFFDRVEQESGFEITTNHLVLFGICPDCQKKR
ncbi:MAG: transcriptional repressor [Chloroflexi bacterium]|nr:transcriptional repressor [Chloroflexota bacterium]